MRMRSRRYVERAVVLGGGINALGVVRSLASRGVPLVVVAHDARLPAMQSRFGRKYRVPEAGLAAIVSALEALAAEQPGQRAVLIVTEEETVAGLAVHYDWLVQHYRLTMPPPASLKALLNKAGIEAVAREAGLRMPRTRRIRHQDDLAELATLKPPLIVKPAVRDAAYARQFRKAYRFDSVDEARALLQRALPVLPDMIVQEWIEGGDSALYFCLQYLPPNGGEAHSFVGHKLRSWPPTVGGTASATPAPEAAGLAETTARFFRAAGVTGLASLEYKFDAIQDEYAVIEPTVGRTDFQEEVATINGVNLPLIAYCDLLGHPHPESVARRRPRIWRERTADVQAMQAAAVRRAIPAGASGVSALWRYHDPKPAVAPLVGRVRARLQRIYTTTRSDC